MKKTEKSLLEPGMELILTKWIGLSGTVQAVKNRESLLLTRFPGAMIRQAGEFASLIDTTKELEEARKAGEILKANREKLDELSSFLLEKETITGEEFMAILNK